MTTLHDAQKRDGATFRTYDGIELPERFRDPTEEAREARRSGGIFDLSFRGSLVVTGEDRLSFLHNLLSNDFEALRPGQGCYATLLTRQSKVVADVIGLCEEDRVVLDVDAHFVTPAKEHLERYLVAEDAELDDGSAEETVVGVHGPHAPQALAGAFEHPPLPDVEYDHRAIDVEGTPVRIVRVSRTGDPGFDLRLPREGARALWDRLVAAGERHGILPCGMAAFDVLRVEAGIPRIGVDFDESILVLEAGLERGIHFRKGCYLGQEVVERATSRGAVRRRLAGLRIDGEELPAVGSRILAGERDVGHVTSAVRSPVVGGPIALGYVRREHLDPGTRLEVEIPGGTAPAEVVELPFHRPD